jgi:hypothetical protein
MGAAFAEARSVVEVAGLHAAGVHSHSRIVGARMACWFAHRSARTRGAKRDFNDDNLFVGTPLEPTQSGCHFVPFHDLRKWRGLASSSDGPSAASSAEEKQRQ